jgi:uncharacterized protein YggE
MRNALLFSVLILLAAGAAAAENDLPTISVQGTATTEVVPDEMIWHLLVQNRGATLETVAADHQRLVGEVLQMLEKAGIDEKKLQTTRMSFGENRVYRNGSHVREGYIATTNVTFTSADLDAYAGLWIRLAGVDGVEVQNVTYDVADRIALQDETRLEALRVARRKAAGLAAVLGATLGEPLQIVESAGAMPHQPMMMNAVRLAESDAGGAGKAHAPGQLTIRMTMSVVFRLVPGQE